MNLIKESSCLLLTVTFLIVSCGGGGGSSNSAVSSGPEPEMQDMGAPASDGEQGPDVGVDEPASNANGIDPDIDVSQPTPADLGGSTYRLLEGASGAVEVKVSENGDTLYSNSSSTSQPGSAIFINRADGTGSTFRTGDPIPNTVGPATFSRERHVSIASDGSVALFASTRPDNLGVLVTVEGEQVTTELVTEQVLSIPGANGAMVDTVENLWKFPSGYAAQLRGVGPVLNVNGQSQILAPGPNVQIEFQGGAGITSCSFDSVSLVGVTTQNHPVLSSRYDNQCQRRRGLAIYREGVGYDALITSGQMVPGMSGITFGRPSTTVGRSTDNETVVVEVTLSGGPLSPLQSPQSYWVVDGESAPKLLFVDGETVDVDGEAVVFGIRRTVTNLHHSSSGWFTFFGDNNSGVDDRIAGLFVGIQREKQPYPDLDNLGASTIVLRHKFGELAPPPYDTTHRFSRFLSPLSLGDGRVAFIGALHRREDSLAFSTPLIGSAEVMGVWISDANGEITLVHEMRAMVRDNAPNLFEYLPGQPLHKGLSGELLLVTKDFSVGLENSTSLVRIPIPE